MMMTSANNNNRLTALLTLSLALFLGACSSSSTPVAPAPAPAPGANPDPDLDFDFDPFASLEEFFCQTLAAENPAGGTPTAGSPGFTSLAEGEVSETQTITLPATIAANAEMGQTNLVSFEQQCASPSADEGCCVLFMYAPGTTISSEESGLGSILGLCEFPGVSLVNPFDSIVASPGAADSEEREISARFYADSACAFSAPAVSSVSTAETITTISGMGQVLMHTGIEAQLIDNRHYYRDVSRRANAGGAGMLAATADIRVERFLDYQGADSLYQAQMTLSNPQGQPDPVIGPRALDALAFTQIVYDFYVGKNVLDVDTAAGRTTSVAPQNSPDNKGSSMIAVIESPAPPMDLLDQCDEGVILRGSDYNAFYDTATREIHFTSPKPEQEPRYANALSSSLDVVAHEWGHAYLDSAAELPYERESGAILEAVADWTAIRIATHAGRAGWVVGDDILATTHPEYAKLDIDLTRDMAEARSVGDSKWKDASSACSPAECNDFCGVHANNGVPNHMFYLLAEGGSNTPNGASEAITVAGIGLENAYAIGYYANNEVWTKQTDFAAARTGMEMAAMTLFVDDANILAQVQNAWAAVGVGESAAAQ